MADHILRNHYTSSTNFKTALQYGQQCLTTSATSLELFNIYLEVARPQVMQGARDPLFISLTGTEIRFGRHLTAFFKRVTGLNITSTRIRSIVTTEAASLRGNDLITAEEQDGVHSHNGHCGVTARKFYQMQDRLRDMTNATAVHNKLLNTLSADDDALANDLNSYESESDLSRSCSPIQAGSNEIDFDSDVSSITETSNDMHRSSAKPSSSFDTSDGASPAKRTHIAGILDRVHQPTSPKRSSFGTSDRASPAKRTHIADTSDRVHQLTSPQRSSFGPSASASPAKRPNIAGTLDVVQPRLLSGQQSFVQPLSVDNVGLLHPSIANSGRTVPWTDTELNIVGTWCKQYRSQHPGNSNVVAACLRYILNDHDVRQHFHPHHVMDSARLRWAHDKYNREHK